MRTRRGPRFRGEDSGHQRELGQRRDADVGLKADIGRKSARQGTPTLCQEPPLNQLQCRPNAIRVTHCTPYLATLHPTFSDRFQQREIR